MTMDDVGGFFLDANGKVWQCIGYCEHPTCTLQRVGTDERMHMVCDSLLAHKSFRRLVVEDPKIVREKA